MQEYGRMPSTNEITNKTNLSRQTIHKHLKEHTNHPQHLKQIEQFRFMVDKVLAKVFAFAVNGDIKACKLYLELMGNVSGNKGNTNINTQNNYIQINGTVLSQETIKHLSRLNYCLNFRYHHNPEQLNSIEAILKSTLK